MLRRLRRLLTAELAQLIRSELASLRGEIQADRHEFHAARDRFEVEMDALRSELQAERAAFMGALEHINHMSALEREARAAPSVEMERLTTAVDAALVTMVLNNIPAS